MKTHDELIIEERVHGTHSPVLFDIICISLIFFMPLIIGLLA